MSGPLEGLRVLDFTWFLAGPYATMVLADLGADVVKVEAPGTGDPTRKVAPFCGDLSSYFLSVNRGKRSICLDLRRPEDRRAALRLAEKADVLVENFTPGRMAEWGFDYSSVSTKNPRLIYASCSGFGQDGPRSREPAFDGIIQALAGTMSITGHPGSEPVRVGFSVADVGAALYLTVGILAALQARHVTGMGQYLEVSLLDAQVSMLENAFSRYFATGEIPQPSGSRHPQVAPFQAFPTRDGYLVVSAGTQEQWELLCDALHRSDLKKDNRFADFVARQVHVSDLEKELFPIFRAASTSDWLQLLPKLGIPCAPIQNIAEAAADPQVLARNMIVELEDPLAGKVRIVNSPLRFSQTAVNASRSAPRLGSSKKEVLDEWLSEN
ncbi:MAG: CoA transferase [Acidobacteria bacterium]|nr:CoA transferase [Acidobacteriota bacterium]